MDLDCEIDILLSTYNGAEYLGEQLASIVAQDIDEWKLIVRDDGSTDDSVEIIEEFASRYPDKVFVISEPSVRLGAAASYDFLLTKSRSQYIAFCDQDDVWLPDKLKKLRECIQHFESISKPETPILVHSDLHVVNENLEKVADSFWQYQKLNPVKMQYLERLLVQNCVTGCASLINKPLLNNILPIPKNVIMHDWWVALIAAAKGEIHHLNAKTVDYRQHEKNDTGAKRWGLNFIFNGLFRNRDLYKQSVIKTRDQAKALLQSGKLSDDQAEVVSQYANLHDSGWFGRRLTIIRMGFFKYGFIRNIALFLWI